MVAVVVAHLRGFSARVNRLRDEDAGQPGAAVHVMLVLDAAVGGADFLLVEERSVTAAGMYIDAGEGAVGALRHEPHALMFGAVGVRVAIGRAALHVRERARHVVAAGGERAAEGDGARRGVDRPGCRGEVAVGVVAVARRHGVGGTAARHAGDGVTLPARRVAIRADVRLVDYVAVRALVERPRG